MTLAFSGKLILVRHAHRDMSDPQADNGLSEKGRAQANALAAELRILLANKDSILYTSPKIRCQETIAPLASALKLNAEIDGRLDTQRPDESSGAMSRRIQEYGAWLRKEIGASTMTFVLCSHGDWIPEFTREFCGQQVSLSKGAFTIF